jgi:hypothetical protein
MILFICKYYEAWDRGAWCGVLDIGNCKCVASVTYTLSKASIGQDAVAIPLKWQDISYIIN